MQAGVGAVTDLFGKDHTSGSIFSKEAHEAAVAKRSPTPTKLIARARAAANGDRGVQNKDLLAALADALEALLEAVQSEDRSLRELVKHLGNERAERAEADRDRLLAAIGDSDLLRLTAFDIDTQIKGSDAVLVPNQAVHLRRIADIAKELGR